MNIRDSITSIEFLGRLEFQIADDPQQTGVFLVRGDERYEVLAVTKEARAPLGMVEHQGALPAMVTGTLNPSRAGAFIEARRIDVLDGKCDPMSINLGRSLVALFEAVEATNAVP